MEHGVCAIVGAGEGLGQALAAAFARKGFDVALVSRSEKGSAAAADAARRGIRKPRSASSPGTRASRKPWKTGWDAWPAKPAASKCSSTT